MGSNVFFHGSHLERRGMVERVDISETERIKRKVETFIYFYVDEW